MLIDDDVQPGGAKRVDHVPSSPHEPTINRVRRLGSRVAEEIDGHPNCRESRRTDHACILVAKCWAPIAFIWWFERICEVDALAEYRSRANGCVRGRRGREVSSVCGPSR
jgi:hypothetical protein